MALEIEAEAARGIDRVADAEARKLEEEAVLVSPVKVQGAITLDGRITVMRSPLPKELRDRFARLIAEGLSGREALRRLQVSAATGARSRRQICASGAARIAVMARPPGSGKLVPHVGFFRELVAQDPDITLFELRDALADAEGATVHHSAIAGLLKRLGFTHKIEEGQKTIQ